MKRFLACATLCLGLLLPVSALAFAPLELREPHAPSKVTFFPTEIMIEVERDMQPEKLPDGDYAYILPLPVSVLRSSLMVLVDGAPAQEMRWLPRPLSISLPSAMRDVSPPVPGLTLDVAEEKDPQRKELLQAYLTALENSSVHAATLNAIEQQTDMWNSVAAGVAKGEAPLPEANTIEALGASLHQNLTRLLQQHTATELTLREANIKLAVAAEDLQRHDRRKNTFLVAVTADNATAKKRVQYRYIIHGSSSLAYTLNASPEKNTLNMAQNITLSQESGMDWNNVETFVALTVRGNSPLPASLSPWFVQYSSKVQSKSMRYESNVYEMAEMPMATAAMANEFSDTPRKVRDVQEMSSFRLWNLGKNTIRSHDEATINLATEIHKAEFFYTLRPSIGKRGFLTARVAFAEPVELPRGKAVCFVDNAFVGEQSLAAHGKEALFFLGEDPQVTIDKRDLTNQSGQTGIFSKEQTRTLHWAYTVKNNRSRAVDVVVEERAPISRDESIVISNTSTPKPEEVMPADAESHQALRLFIWKKKINPAETMTIDHKITINANPDKQLDM